MLNWYVVIKSIVDPIRLNFELEDIKAEGSGIVKGKTVGDADLKKPFNEALRTPLTCRIIEFAGMEYITPINIKLYDGTTDLEDHLNRFANAAKFEEWPMLVWCRMFLKTLDGSTRGWFKRLPSGSINEWSELKEAFTAGYSVRKACFKEPHEITKIDSLKCPELVKRNSDKVPQMVEEMMVRLDDFVHSEEAFAHTKLPKGEACEHPRRTLLLVVWRDDQDVSEEPLIIEAEMKGYLVRWVYVDEGASVEVMFEHCFENLSPAIMAMYKDTQTDLVGLLEKSLSYWKRLIWKYVLETRKKQMIEEKPIEEEKENEGNTKEVSVTEDVEYLNTHKGFTAALAILITEASQSRQHDKSEPISYYLPDYAVNPCSAFLCLDTLVRLPIDMRLKIDLENHINESLRDLIWSVCVLFPDVESCSIMLGDVDLLLGQLINSAVGTFLHWQWQNSSSSGNYFALPVGTSSSSGNTSLHEIRESKAYKTYLGYATGAIPPKKARMFKKPSSSKLYNVPASPEEPIRKSKRVKRPAKKSSDAPTASVVIRENPVKSLSKKKEKMTVEKRKGIDLLSEVALTKEAQYEEVSKKSLRDFHKTRLSGSGTVTKIAPSAVKIKPSVTNEGICAKPGVPDVTEEESTKSNDQERDNGDENTQSDSEKGSYFRHETDENELGSESDQEENEEEIEDDEEKEEDELNEPVTTDEGFIQKEGTDAEMTNVQQGNEISEITLNQGMEDAHMTLSTVLQKTEVPVTSSSYSSDLASKFLNFSDIPHTYAEIVSPIDVHIHHEVPSNQTHILLTVHVSVITESLPIFTTIIPQSLPTFTPPQQKSTPTPPPTTEATNPLSTLPNFASIFQFNNRLTTLEKEVAELKKNDPLNTQVTALDDEHLDSRLGATRDEFMATFQHQSLLGSQRKSKVKCPRFYQRKCLTLLLRLRVEKEEDNKDAEPTKGPISKESKFGSSKGTKSQSTSSRKSVHVEEPKFEVADSNMLQDQEENLRNDDEVPKGKVASKLDWFTKPKRPQEPTDPN
nr:hypothetical protein [Tanacetum cinerariifolium]